MRAAHPSVPYIAPTQCGMPSLSSLDRKLRANMLLSQMFRSKSLPADYTARVMIGTFVRIVERAVEEYEISRSRMCDFIKQPSVSLFSLFYASDHLEVCISLIDRTCNFLARMSEHEEICVYVPVLDVMKKENRRRISILRNANEHLETRLLKDSIQEGDSVMLCLDNDSCELERCKISYVELACWLTQLHELASRYASKGTAP